ncbi:O-antigen ligase [Sedimentibacter acidaminivorans]|uniref:O-antigen ligase n=1 Tax=Sedimentibacter acidaminivorans TaxID=913099 RepID=A0ABS4G9B8_9FIRM|nr:O-antigen ligase family protein [Sedimentibacter acidaminivorans]MBP1924261.1 O-antigen ligase [Sedimentibacter acidaminivorans]
MIIKKKGLFKSILMNLIIIALFVISDNPKYLWFFYIAGAIFISIEFFDKIFIKDSIIITFHTKISFVFLLICSFSIFWSIEPGYDYLKFLIFNFFLMFALNNYVDSREKFDKTIKSLILAGLILSIYVLLVSGGNFISSQRLVIDGHNSNSIGMYLSFSLLVSIYFFDKNHNIKYLLTVPIYMIVIFLSGSKKSLFLLIFLVVFYMFYKRKGITKKMINFMISIVFISLILYLVFSIPWAYEILGTRILDLINAITSGNTGQDTIRFYMIEFGIDKFRERPLIGYGLGNYRILLNNAIGIYMYAHNNFIELLVSVGLIGFITYYIIYIYIIKGLINRYRNDTNIIAFLLAIMIGIVIAEIGLVSYYSTFFQLMVALSFIGLRIVNSAVDENTWVKKR